jgi:uncharacterized oligopeptide transporter (OPT) family protein
MIFARCVFWLAAAFGFAAVYPVYRMPGTSTYCGMIAKLIAWQTAFVVIGVNPRRYRWLMIPAVLEKGLRMITLLVVHTRGQADRRNIVLNAATHGAFVIPPNKEHVA